MRRIQRILSIVALLWVGGWAFAQEGPKLTDTDFYRKIAILQLTVDKYEHEIIPGLNAKVDALTKENQRLAKLCGDNCTEESQ